MQHFFAYLDRLRLIRRWGLMHSVVPENDMEHSMQVAVIAHGLALLGVTRWHREVSPEHVLALALYHDASEVLTGDLPTPIKHKNAFIMEAYHEIEGDARTQLLGMLPEDIRPCYCQYIQPDEEAYEWRLVKAADRISAYLKCVQEEKMGNREFAQARVSILESINAIQLPEVQTFMSEFAPSFSLSLDEINRP